MKKKKQSGSKKSFGEVKDGDVPGTYAKQNLGHNSKKEGLGRNTDR
jgi:hypothetical protein